MIITLAKLVKKIISVSLPESHLIQLIQRPLQRKKTHRSKTQIKAADDDTDHTQYWSDWFDSPSDHSSCFL